MILTEFEFYRPDLIEWYKSETNSKVKTAISEILVDNLLTLDDHEITISKQHWIVFKRENVKFGLVDYNSKIDILLSLFNIETEMLNDFETIFYDCNIRSVVDDKVNSRLYDSSKGETMLEINYNTKDIIVNHNIYKMYKKMYDREFNETSLFLSEWFFRFDTELKSFKIRRGLPSADFYVVNGNKWKS